MLLIAARRVSSQPIRLSSWPPFVPGALLAAFGWWYPHFVQVDLLAEYAYAAPLGLIPCPTLAALIGFTLIFGLFRSKTWAVPLITAGALYGAIGAFVLAVGLDYGLLAGVIVLAGAMSQQHQRKRSTVPAPGRWRWEW